MAGIVSAGNATHNEVDVMKPNKSELREMLVKKLVEFGEPGHPVLEFIAMGGRRAARAVAVNDYRPNQLDELCRARCEQEPPLPFNCVIVREGLLPFTLASLHLADRCESLMINYYGVYDTFCSFALLHVIIFQEH